MAEPEKKQEEVEKKEEKAPEKPRLSRNVAIALLVIFGVIILFFLRIKEEPAETTPSPSPQIEQSVSEENKTSLKTIFGDQIDSSFYAKASSVDAKIEGKVQDDGLKINKVYWLPFNAGVENVPVIEEHTGLALNPGPYSAFFVETVAPPNNPALSFQMGAAFGPDGYPLGTADPQNIELIMRYPHSTALFNTPLPPDYPWQEVPAFGVADNFVPLDAMGYNYFNPDQNLSVWIIPQRLVGLPGESTTLTFQIYGEDMANPDNFGVGGVTCSLDNIPTPVDAGIFADGFESGDTSAWSNSYCNQ